MMQGIDYLFNSGCKGCRLVPRQPAVCYGGGVSQEHGRVGRQRQAALESEGGGYYSLVPRLGSFWSHSQYVHLVR